DVCSSDLDGQDILRSPNFECSDLVSKLARRCLNRAHFQHGSGASNIGHDRQPAATRDNLAREFEALVSKIELLIRQSGEVATRSSQTGDQVITDRGCGQG